MEGDIVIRGESAGAGRGWKIAGILGVTGTVILAGTVGWMMFGPGDKSEKEEKIESLSSELGKKEEELASLREELAEIGEGGGGMIDFEKYFVVPGWGVKFKKDTKNLTEYSHTFSSHKINVTADYLPEAGGALSTFADIRECKSGLVTVGRMVKEVIDLEVNEFYKARTVGEIDGWVYYLEASNGFCSKVESEFSNETKAREALIEMFSRPEAI